jgi:hypothetical protein
LLRFTWALLDFEEELLLRFTWVLVFDEPLRLTCAKDSQGAAARAAAMMTDKAVLMIIRFIIV